MNQVVEIKKQQQICLCNNLANTASAWLLKKQVENNSAAQLRQKAKNKECLASFFYEPIWSPLCMCPAEFPPSQSFQEKDISQTHNTHDFTKTILAIIIILVVEKKKNLLDFL